MSQSNQSGQIPRDGIQNQQLQNNSAINANQQQPKQQLDIKQDQPQQQQQSQQLQQAQTQSQVPVQKDLAPQQQQPQQKQVQPLQQSQTQAQQQQSKDQVQQPAINQQQQQLKPPNDKTGLPSDKQQFPDSTQQQTKTKTTEPNLLNDSHQGLDDDQLPEGYGSNNQINKQANGIDDSQDHWQDHDSSIQNQHQQLSSQGGGTGTGGNNFQQANKNKKKANNNNNSKYAPYDNDDLADNLEDDQFDQHLQSIDPHNTTDDINNSIDHEMQDQQYWQDEMADKVKVVTFKKKKKNQKSYMTPAALNFPKIICHLHNKEVSKVCMRDDCNSKMMICIDCVQEFPEHFMEHKPFQSTRDFLKYIEENPHAKRKEKVKEIYEGADFLVEAVLQKLAAEKDRVKNEYIPELKLWFDEQCEELENHLNWEIDRYGKMFRQNADYLRRFLEDGDLVNEMHRRVPDLNELKQKYLDIQGDAKLFEEHLENIYRQILNLRSLEMNKNQFNYYEEMYKNFKEQIENLPQYIGNSELQKQIGAVFKQFYYADTLKFDTVVPKFPICSMCNRELECGSDAQQAFVNKKKLIGSIQSGTTHQTNIGNIYYNDNLRLGAGNNGDRNVSPLQNRSFSNQDGHNNRVGGDSAGNNIFVNTKKKKMQLAPILTGSNSSAVLIKGSTGGTIDMMQLQAHSTKLQSKKRLYAAVGSRNDNRKQNNQIIQDQNTATQIQQGKNMVKYIEATDDNAAGKCIGCSRLYCPSCQQKGCRSCRIYMDYDFRSIKTLLMEGGQRIVMDDTQQENRIIPLEVARLNIALAVNSQQYYTGRYEWDVLIENNGGCLTLGFGICIKSELQRELREGYDMKEDLQTKDWLMMLLSNGQVTGGLKGKAVRIATERKLIMRCVLDLKKRFFTIQGKNIYLQRQLLDNEGYCPIFYAGCCFKSYNNFQVKQIYTFEKANEVKEVVYDQDGAALLMNQLQDQDRVPEFEKFKDAQLQQQQRTTITQAQVTVTKQSITNIEPIVDKQAQANTNKVTVVNNNNTNSQATVQKTQDSTASKDKDKNNVTKPQQQPQQPSQTQQQAKDNKAGVTNNANAKTDNKPTVSNDKQKAQQPQPEPPKGKTTAKK